MPEILNTSSMQCKAASLEAIHSFTDWCPSVILINSKYTSYGLDRKEGKFQGLAQNYVGNAKKNLRLTVSTSIAPVAIS